MTTSLNYAPLTSPMDAKHVERFRREAEASGVTNARPLWLIVIAVVYLGLAVFTCFVVIRETVKFVGTNLSGGEPAAMTFIVFVALALAGTLALLGTFFYRVLFSNPPWERWLRLERFAAANGLEFATEVGS